MSITYEKEDFQFLFNAINDAIFIHAYKEKGFEKFIEVNDIACRRYGYTREELCSMTAEDITKKSDVKSHAAPKFREKLAKAGKLIIDTYHIKKNGEEFPVEINSNIITKDGKKLILAVVRDVSDRKAAENALKHNLMEKETLLKELYHRTKNNMQIICSLLELERKKQNSPENMNILEDLESKIQSMALVHQQLYESNNLYKLKLNTYIRDLLNNLEKSYLSDNKPISIRCVCEEIEAGIETVIPLGLIINELVINAIKHGFNENEKGEITLELSLPDKKMLILKVCDNGKGLPPGIDSIEKHSLGLETVFTLCRDQLNGKIKTDNKKGCCWVIEIPV